MATGVPERHVQIAIGPALLSGDLRVPSCAPAVVAFAHGSGSSRLSPRNRFVADALVRHGLATLLIDLLTLAEESADLETAALRFDIPLLADRLGGVTDWLRDEPQTRAMAVGYFGASTGAAAALVAAADRPRTVGAIVSRGGRPDLARPVLNRIRQPSLLIVGGADELVLDMNNTALVELAGPKHLAIVPGATHLFEEPGALDQVASLASDWFQRYLVDRG